MSSRAARRRPPGLAAERTALSWVRSLTGLVGVGLLVTRAMLMRWPLWAAAVAACSVGVLVLTACALGERRWAALRRPQPGPPHPALVAGVTAGALIAAVLGGAVLAR